jgi:uncharacterized protein
MLHYFQVLILLWLINFAPPLLAHLLGPRWNSPMDKGLLFGDGRPLLGPHKTLRGFLGGIAASLVVGCTLGFPLWIAFLTGLLSMLGDLTSSFIKRRCDLPSGSVVLGLDQIFEGLFPFTVLSPFLGLNILSVLILTTLFVLGAHLGSRFFKEILLQKPYENYRRSVNSRVRLRELRACQIISNPLHHFLNFEDAIYYHFILGYFFRIARLYNKGMLNALKVKVCRITFEFDDLPPAFDGYRILFISDLHLDGLKGLTEKLQTILRDHPADICVVGGDLRMETHGPSSTALAHMRRVIPAIQSKDGIIGILGNHDCIEMVEPLEEAGMTYLVNDAVAIERNGARIWFVGVDDPHYYRCHDLKQAFQQVQEDEFAILLAHSNELYREACEYRPKLYICGHTHAGQIQIPPIGPIFTHSRAPRRYSRGVWRYRGMIGYTSCGVGVSGVPLRFFSHGEVSLICLKRRSLFKNE